MLRDTKVVHCCEPTGNIKCYIQMEQVLFRDLGKMSYSDAWTLQTEIHRDLINNKLAHRELPMEDFSQTHQFLYVEHPPVFTLGKSGSVENLLLSPEELDARSIEYYPINRGGDITYHGPGQIVCYPILDLDRFFNDVHKYVRNLEEMVIRTLAEFGIKGFRIKDYTGVWVEGLPSRPVAADETAFFKQQRKICAIGVHMSRWTTLHGLAFNVNTDLSYFDLIVPCGINDQDKAVTSMEKELGQRMDIEDVKSRLSRHFEAVFGCTLTK
ncbi:MAG: lipoyl(octanoyl) transferase LipB [Saprospiraceae bacterium]